MTRSAPRSEEAPEERGLGVVPGVVRRFATRDAAVPHMGWNGVVKANAASRCVARGRGCGRRG